MARVTVFWSRATSRRVEPVRSRPPSRRASIEAYAGNTSEIEPAPLTVGPPGESSQNDLLLP